jgi:uncharacterized protein YmfQ (DUF2313 family)
MALMARTGDDYGQLLRQLLPEGPAWDGPLMAGALGAWGDGLARFEQHIDALAAELDPRTAIELLPEWEMSYGLPDPCLGGAPTIAQRHASLMARVPGDGGLEPARYVALAARLGFTVSVTEYSAWTCDDPCDQPIYDEAWNWAWAVNAPAVTTFEFTCQSGCDEPLRVWGNAVLECSIRAVAPGHGTVIFTYGG